MNTTVVAVVGDVQDESLAAAASPNVSIVRGDPDAAPLDRAVDVWQRLRHASTPYVLVDTDPLESVADAWAARFDGTGVVGDLEVARSATLARWRSSSIDLPDYYLLVDPEALSPTHRHWYLGVLASVAPTRVVAAQDGRPSVGAIGRRHYGRWWPELDRLLDGVEHQVPDRVGTGAEAEEGLGATLVEPARLYRPDDH